jgi:hypothetical protein
VIIKELTETEALELLTIRKKAGEPEPEKGSHIGNGRHVTMPESWDGNGKIPPGWSGLSGVVFDAEKGSYTVEILDLDQAGKDKLSASEIKKIDDAIKSKPPEEEL